MGLNTSALIKKLDKTSLDALQAGAGLCLSRTNPSVEIEHWLLKLADVADGDLAKIFRHFEVDPAPHPGGIDAGDRQIQDGSFADARVVDVDRRARTRSLARGVDPVPSRSNSLGRVIARVALGRQARRLIRESSRELAKVQPEPLWSNLLDVVKGSSEDAQIAGLAADGAVGTAGAGGSTAAGTASKTPSLDQFTINLTEAREGRD